MKHKLSLVMNLIRQHGFFKTMYLLMKMIFFKIFDLSFSKKNETIIKNAIKNKRVVVFTKAIEWNNMFQRIQQMALVFSKQEDTIVIYTENCTTHDFFVNINQINDNLFCYSYRHYDKLNEFLVDAKEVVMYMTNLFAFDQNITLKHDKMVYEYVDELELFFDDLELATKRHNNALELADLSIATATKLFNQIEPLSKKAILSPNAVDYDTFHGSKDKSIAQDIVNVVGKYDIILGYYGALASWFDFETVIEVAKRKPNWAFVLVGVCFDDTIEQYHIENYPNIFLTGPKPYQTLPSYISGIDVLTIPFVVNNITESTSPVKLFEYMASSTPILTSELPECKKYSSVYRYHDANDFIEKAQMLYNKKENKEYKELLDKEAKENTWDARIKQILTALYE